MQIETKLCQQSSTKFPEVKSALRWYKWAKDTAWLWLRDFNNVLRKNSDSDT